MAVWIAHLDGGPRRVNHAAVALGHKIYSFGGYCSQDDHADIRPIDVHVLNTVNLRWTLLPQPDVSLVQRAVPCQRYGLTVVEFNKQMFLWGGRHDTAGACNILYVYQPATNSWFRPATTGSTPNPRDGHSANVVNTHMYIFGGFDGLQSLYSSEVYAIDLISFNWTNIKLSGSIPQPRDFQSTVLHSGSILMFGGRSDRSWHFHTRQEMYSNMISRFDPRTGAWTEIAKSGTEPGGRRSHSAWMFDGDMYVFGGYNCLSNQHFSNLYRYSPDLNSWSEVETFGQGPCKRRRQTCVLIQNKIFLFGGTAPTPHSHINTENDLLDRNDLYVLDMRRSLRTLCFVRIIELKLDVSELPRILQMEIQSLTTNNTITASKYGHSPSE